MAPFSIKRLCTPASIYFWISVISIVISYLGNYQLVNSLVSLLFVLFWTWCLNMLCSKGYKSVSWFLVLLPLICMAYVALKMNNVIRF